MGIPGILKEIGPGERVAILKLAVEHLEKTGRPLRIAIDISIWQFQVQTGRGGTNPALRTLYYRLLRLLSLCIQPLFVFDGPNRPLVKRGRQTGGGNTSSMPNYMAKNLLDLFGFPYISAPGEAEAECALLQQEGIVDAVLSDDVDTLMFGSTLTLRNWSSEGTRGNKNPTHVNAYHSKSTKEGPSGLDRAGMILVALMSGGDYAPAGIPNCGPKIACEAARAGFGEDLCKISCKDRTSLNQWRERLEYELNTNESGFFRTRHKTLGIPEKFPDRTILGYYTHPVVSSSDRIADLKHSILWDAEVKVPELRAFAGEAFEWLGLPGAKKFIRGIAPALLIQKLRRRSVSDEIDSDDLKLKAEQESRLVKSIHGKRTHFITDGLPELKVAFLPSEIAGLDLTLEETEVYLGMNLNDDSESDIVEITEFDENCPASPSKRRGPSRFDPEKQQKMWIMETFAKLGVPLTVESWEEDMRNPKKYAARKAPKVKPPGKSGNAIAPTGNLETYLRASKPRRTSPDDGQKLSATVPIKTPNSGHAHNQSRTVLAELLETNSEACDKRDKASKPLDRTNPATRRSRPNTKALSKPSKKTTPRKQFNVPSDPPLSKEINPWTLSHTSSSRLEPESEIAQQHCASSQREEAARFVSNLGKGRLRSPRKVTDIVSLLSSPENSQTGAPIPINEACEIPTLLAKKNANGLRHDKNHDSGVTRRQINRPGTQLPRSHDMADPLPAHKVSRRLKFSAAESHDQTPPSSSQPQLPPLSEFVIPRGLATIYRASHGKTSLDNARRKLLEMDATAVVSSRKIISLRESLEGAWKMVDDLDVARRNPRLVFQGVEVVDLSED